MTTITAMLTATVLAVLAAVLYGWIAVALVRPRGRRR